MSAKNRGGPSVPLDQYLTPRWCVRQMVEHVLPRTLDRSNLWWQDELRILEPASGPGVIVDALRARWPRARITSIDLDETVRPSVSDVHEARDFLSYMPRSSSFDLAVTNPPFTPALPFAQHLILDMQVPVVVLLLRLGFLASDARQDFLRAHPPAFVDVLAHRPNFELPDDYVLPHKEGKGKSAGRCGRCRLPSWMWGSDDDHGCSFKGGDSADYAWFSWVQGHKGATALNVLPKVPLAERKPSTAKEAE